MAAARQERLLRIAVAATAVAVVVQVVTQLIDFGVYDLRVKALDSDTHESVFGVLSLLAQAAAALACARYAPRSAHPRDWSALAAVVGALLVLRILIPYNAGLLVAPTAAAFAMYWRVSTEEREHVRSVIRTALCLLAFSFLVHAVGPRIVSALGYGGGSWAYQVKGILKHTAELAGWTLLAAAVLCARAEPRDEHHS